MVQLYAATRTTITTGGQSIVAIYGPVKGGFITNPNTPLSQGIPGPAEDLYVDIIAPAVLSQTGTTTRIPPGNTYYLPDNIPGPVYVNAATTGHRFSAIVYQPSPGFIPASGTFPPTGPVTLTTVVKSYLYQQYFDDDDLQAFIRAFNNLTQQYIDWFANVGLPVYTGDPISGTLLDWVAANLYDQTRPVLSSGKNKFLGPLNTFMANQLAPNAQKVIGPDDVFITTDDIFKRIITWNTFKGDGRTINVRWIKRRIMRFLTGVNGSAPNVDNTYQVSISFGINSQINIRLVSGIRTITGGALPNRFALNAMSANELLTMFNSIPVLPNAMVFKEAMDSGVLLMPFPNQVVVEVG